MGQWPRFLLVAMVVSALFTLSACELKILHAGNHTFSHMEATFRYYTGTENGKFKVEESEPVTVHYNSKVEQGTLTLQVKGPNETVELPSGEEGDRVFAEPGVYQVLVEGKGARGGYKVSWTK